MAHFGADVGALGRDDVLGLVEQAADFRGPLALNDQLGDGELCFGEFGEYPAEGAAVSVSLAQGGRDGVELVLQGAHPSLVGCLVDKLEILRGRDAAEEEEDDVILSQALWAKKR